jgi:hypothetical protein
MNELASTLYAQGDLGGARKLEEQVLEASRRVLGEDHPHTLTAMNNRASTLSAQGVDVGEKRSHSGRCWTGPVIHPEPRW